LNNGIFKNNSNWLAARQLACSLQCAQIFLLFY